jgi:hypothetical protein
MRNTVFWHLTPYEGVSVEPEAGIFIVQEWVPIPVLAIFGRLTLDFRESKCFLLGPETLVEMK